MYTLIASFKVWISQLRDTDLLNRYFKQLRI